MNLSEYIQEHLYKVPHKSSAAAADSRHTEINYVSNREYEDTLLMLFLAAKNHGYCGLNCYYNRGSRDINTVRILKLDFTKKIESLQTQIQKKQAELANLSREDSVRQVQNLVKGLLRTLPDNICTLNAVKARMGMLEKFFSDIKESEEYKILLIKSLAHQVAQVESCSDADAAQIAVMDLFSTVRDALKNKMDMAECDIEFTQSYVKGIGPDLLSLVLTDSPKSNLDTVTAGDTTHDASSSQINDLDLDTVIDTSETIREQIEKRFESSQNFLKRSIESYENEIEQFRRKQFTADTIMDLLTTVFYIPRHWTIEVLDDAF